MSAKKLEVLLEPFRLELFKPFRISRDVYDYKDGIRVLLKYNGLTGLGEANEHVYYQVTQRDLHTHLLELKKVVEQQDLIHPAEMYQLMEKSIGFQPFSLAAMDIAYWDLYAQSKEVPTRELFDLQSQGSIQNHSSYTISIDSLEEMKKEVLAHPFHYYKVKLGTADDIQLMQQLLSMSESKFYIDANCAWDLNYALKFARSFENSNLVMIEQPMPSGKWDDMQILKQKTGISLVADESFIHWNDLPKCLDSFDGINIKLLKCGGITPAINIICQAQKLNAPVMIGCMMESTIGISAASQFTPWAKFIDIDSALFLKNDPASGLEIRSDGEIILSDKPGNGCALNSIH